MSREVFAAIWPEGQVEGQGGGVPLDLLGVLRQNPRATGQIGARVSNHNCKVRPVGGPLFAGATELLLERFPFSYCAST
jgi:hypothetical protein